MPNWGKPDFDTSINIDYESLHEQILREDPTALTAWPYNGPLGFDHVTVKRYCVDTTYPEVAAWQRIRLSMKGKPTHKKLAILMSWFQKDNDNPNPCCELLRSTEVQVYNYLGALRRGGQLDEHNRIRKYI